VLDSFVCVVYVLTHGVAVQQEYTMCLPVILQTHIEWMVTIGITTILQRNYPKLYAQ
jgi:hypothetical protein